MDLVEAASSGDRRQTLVALRDHLAQSMIDAPPGAVASIAKQLREVLAELAALAPKQEGTALDELAKRRRSGKPAAKDRAAP